mgnify:CR=1 FL=1
MAKPLTQEEYLLLSEEERMAARLGSLQAALQVRRDAAPVRRRGVTEEPSTVSSLGSEQSDETTVTRAASTPDGKRQRRRLLMEFKTTLSNEKALVRVSSKPRLRRAAIKAGISEEQAEEFLTELGKSSAS